MMAFRPQNIALAVCSRIWCHRKRRHVLNISILLLIFGLFLMLQDLLAQTNSIATKQLVDGKVYITLYNHSRTTLNSTNETATQRMLIQQNRSDLGIKVPSKRTNFSSTSKKSQLPLLFSPIIGRLGNEIFQFVAKYIIAKTTSHQNVLDTNSVLPRLFSNIPGVHTDLEAAKREAHPSIFEEGAGIYSEKMIKEVAKTSINAGICCYFQSWRYMAGYEKEIRRILHIHDDIQETVAEYIHTQASLALHRIGRQNHGRLVPTSLQNFTFIGVHVRKADMAISESQKRGYTDAPASYILKAIQFYRDHYQYPLYFIASDDMTWCRNNLKTDYDDFVFVSHKSSSEFHDFASLVQCNHTVITSGTFGWWAGWLTGGTVVYFSGFPKPNTEIGSQYKATDYYPPQWIPMT